MIQIPKIGFLVVTIFSFVSSLDFITNTTQLPGSKKLKSKLLNEDDVGWIRIKTEGVIVLFINDLFITSLYVK